MLDQAGDQGQVGAERGGGPQAGYGAGRMKFVRPLYRDLYSWEEKRQLAIDLPPGPQGRDDVRLRGDGGEGSHQAVISVI